MDNVHTSFCRIPCPSKRLPRPHSGSAASWSAANIKVYGGGVADDGFLRALSDLIGDYSYTNVSVSSGKSGRSRSRHEGKERIFDVSNLAELDRGRAVVLASGAPATLVRTLPWYTGPHKEAVEASIKPTVPAVTRTQCQYSPPSPTKSASRHGAGGDPVD